MYDEDDFDDCLIEEMNFPIKDGYYVYVLRKHCNTDDEKFMCTLYNPHGEIVPMTDTDNRDFEMDVVKGYSYVCVFEFIEDAGRKVTALTELCCPNCKRRY